MSDKSKSNEIHITRMYDAPIEAVWDAAEEAPDRTRVTITWQPYGKITAQEIETFVKAKGGMTQGWTGSLDKLESHLEGSTTQGA